MCAGLRRFADTRRHGHGAGPINIRARTQLPCPDIYAPGNSGQGDFTDLGACPMARAAVPGLLGYYHQLRGRVSAGPAAA